MKKCIYKNKSMKKFILTVLVFLCIISLYSGQTKVPGVVVDHS